MRPEDCLDTDPEEFCEGRGRSTDVVPSHFCAQTSDSTRVLRRDASFSNELSSARIRTVRLCLLCRSRPPNLLNVEAQYKIMRHSVCIQMGRASIYAPPREAAFIILGRIMRDAMHVVIVLHETPLG